MPNDYPYFPFYVDDFVSDGNVEAMTTLEVGAYTLLLCKAWKEKPRGTLPDDDVVLARWARVTPDQWREVRPRVLACFRLGRDGRWHQKRMELEARKLHDLSNKRSQAGREGAKGRWQTHGKRIDLPLRSQCDSMPRASDSDSNSGSSKRRKKGVQGGGGGIPPPLNTPEFQVAWERWQKHRREIGHALKETTAESQLKTLAAKGLELAIATLENSIMHGYQGLVEPRHSGNGQHNKLTQPTAAQVLAETRRKEAEREQRKQQQAPPAPPPPPQETTWDAGF